MPYPDELPPEIWHHIVSISRPDISHLKPWLKVAPFTCAKGMHDAAFAHIFRELHLSMQRQEDWSAEISRLSRYSKHPQLHSAVRRFSSWWKAGHFLDPRLGISSEELKKQEVSMKKAEKLVCAVLNKIEILRELYWSNYHFPKYTIKDTIYKSLERHFPSLTTLTLSGTLFDEPLDLRSATSLSNLEMTHVRLTSTSHSPSVLLSTKISFILLSDVLSRDISFPWAVDHEESSSAEFRNSASDIVTSLDLSQITRLHFGEHVGFSNMDLLHLFPPTLSSKSVGDQLVFLNFLKAGLLVITTLSKCQLFPKLQHFRIHVLVEAIVSENHAERTISDLSSFIGKQKALTDLEVNLSGLYRFGPEDIEEENVRAFDDALAGESLRNALAGLKHLRRLSLATYILGMRYPGLNGAFVRALPALEVFIVGCVSIESLTAKQLAQAFNEYPKLRFVKIDPNNPEERGEEALALAKALSEAMRRHAPRIQYCSIQRNRFRLRGVRRVEEVILFDPDAREVIRQLDWFG